MPSMKAARRLTILLILAVLILVITVLVAVFVTILVAIFVCHDLSFLSDFMLN